MIVAQSPHEVCANEIIIIQTEKLNKILFFLKIEKSLKNRKIIKPKNTTKFIISDKTKKNEKKSQIPRGRINLKSRISFLLDLFFYLKAMLISQTLL